LCETLDWVPPFTLEQGLAETAQWFKHRHTTDSHGR
jgi:nucleoside-diphosphate-sugar epimerase